MLTKSLLCIFAIFFSIHHAHACSCTITSQDPQDHIDQAEYIFFGYPGYMFVRDVEKDGSSHSRQEAQTVFLVTDVYKGTLRREFRGDLPAYLDRVGRANDGALISVFHGFQSQAACDIRFEFQPQLVMAYERDGRLETDFCSMLLLEAYPEREQEFIDILNRIDQ